MGSLDFSVVWTNLGFLGNGLALSALLVVVSSVGGMILGGGLAALRLSRHRILRLPAGAYVTVIRSVPLILVLFWFYFMLPLWTGHTIGALPSALIAYVMFEAAFYCEIIRAGVRAVPPGQSMAAAATGLRPWQMMRLVVLPQALVAMEPLLVNQVVILFQDTALVYVVALRDFLTAASVIASRDDRPVELYGFVAVVYFVICLAGSQLAGRRRGEVIQ
ncbi:MAG TPA: amino acid ABC transporter permease [Aliidongia sp.]|uniref:amino acid ABC transporter permease n=1 Tax=Aliidongia sp. TaxID=1914230 RepID=UPI002DDD7C94|nr:amino acid ABC transporter permease [Aliidongia sp.]HEV2673653.1 amino acid ABC transporter permease [Aliidongia sp.]